MFLRGVLSNGYVGNLRILSGRWLSSVLDGQCFFWKLVKFLINGFNLLINQFILTNMAKKIKKPYKCKYCVKAYTTLRARMHHIKVEFLKEENANSPIVHELSSFLNKGANSI